MYRGFFFFNFIPLCRTHGVSRMIRFRYVGLELGWSGRLDRPELLIGPFGGKR